MNAHVPNARLFGAVLAGSLVLAGVSPVRAVERRSPQASGAAGQQVTAAAQTLTGEAPGAARIRPTGPRAAYTLAQGLARSKTIRALVDRLVRSDVITYLAFEPRRSDPCAHIRFVGASGAFRYVRIVLPDHLTTRQTVVLLGHELQHAVEVAEHERIRDAASFDEFYRMLGLYRAASARADSQAARDAGDRVRLELQTALRMNRY
jgi:hypothetical protein